jgi:hypothetical protein
MSDTVVVALIGLVAGAAGSLAAPWANWGVEKKRETLAHRRALIASWRTGLAEYERRLVKGEVADGEPMTLEWYSTLRPHLNKVNDIEGGNRFVAVVSSNREVDAVIIADELDRIERDWGFA